MALSSGRHFYLNAVCLLVFVISIGLVESLDRSQKSFLRDSLLARAKEELSIVRSELESAIVSDIYVVNSLPALVASNPEFEFSGWDLIASSVIRKSSHVQLLGLAPDDVIQYIYPLEGNEKALGLDYRTIPSQWRTVKKAQDLQEIFIAGPINLVQGGLALIARVPIFSDPPYNSRYWGVCSVVISLESLFLDAGVSSFEHRYNIAIRGRDSTGIDGEVFYGLQSTFDQAFAIESVHFPYGNWVIAASTKKDLLAAKPWYQVHAVRLLGYPMILLLLGAFTLTYRLYAAASKRSLQDELTLLPNRRYFMYTLREHFDAVRKRHEQDRFAILNIDLDKFKAINDTFGHAAGDKVLIATAERLKSVLRTSDVVARIGGDEFLILLPRIENSNDIDVINIELQKAICHTPVIYEQHLINLQVSVGYAIYKPEFNDIDDMLKLADSRMYQEKRRQLQRTITN
ncbi:diguanylate cyclase [Vibrio tubiashii]|uniref:Sensor domain-containing diguanylate cyclase n=1 Tax=Vibrio tubiashii TaxID=29498 RepID=A0AAE5LH53_9VIBR|nr:diguanylate cyclase [Vibrio tubiashii]MCG9580321.1 sensor domain-containing diguanylate cyclase [Vibrio tubiashii]MCG9613912.1 sensor domain-containing diguanylate cyclase [Vibrio tubiashii]NOI80020.1 sensor domain-containing diguanylate cyclase [Vibrio tubiashii]